DPPPLLDCVPNLSPALAQLVHRLLTKSPADRPENAASVQMELARIEMECLKPGAASEFAGPQANLLDSGLPAANTEAVAEASWPPVTPSLRDWPSVRIRLRYRQQPVLSRRSLLFWGAVAAASAVGAALYLIAQESRKEKHPDAPKGANKPTR